jgi:transposase-like protein
MDNDVRKRIRWVRLYEELGNAGVVCLKCGISRPRLRKWWKRYQESASTGRKPQAEDLAELEDISGTRRTRC